VRAMQAAGKALGGTGARACWLRDVAATAPFQALHREVAEATVASLQEHWSARLSVHLQTRLDLSREGMERLRHLLSFVYDFASDKYHAIKVWVNETDDADFVTAVSLPGRHVREKLYKSLCVGANIKVDAKTGRCERNTVKVTDALYNKYKRALRSNYSAHRPAQPVFYFDATGAGLGKGLTHAEMGTADYAGQALQSRATLQPLAGYNDSDHAVPLRENLPAVFDSFNLMVLAAMINPSDFDAPLPARPLVGGDMQGIKALFGMTEGCHSVWCWCQAKNHHKRPTRRLTSWAEILSFYAEVGCKLKTEEDMCELAHYSFGIHRGGAFTPVKCRACGYCQDCEEDWRADLDAFEGGTEDAQKEARQVHNEKGVAPPLMAKHHHQLLFMPPLPFFGMERASCDILHLIYLNLFKRLWGAHHPQ
jgi:hypothetical protein